MRRIVTAREQAEMLAPWRQAGTQYLLPGMPARQHQPAQSNHEQDYDDDSWDRGYWKPSDSTAPQHEQWDDYEESDDSDDWRHEPWMHVSPHKIEPGTVLLPSGGKSPYNKTLAPGHGSNVWIDHPHKMKGWTDEMREHNPDSKFYYYHVQPDEKPEPNVLGHELGWAVPSARIVHRQDDFDPEYPGDY